MTEQLQLATQIAKTLGLPPSWPNLRTIEIALIFHAAQSDTSLQETAQTIIGCAREFYRLSPAKLKTLGIERYWPLNRFWFEDAIWQVFLPLPGSQQVPPEAA